jgi:hypothetical protein
MARAMELLHTIEPDTSDLVERLERQAAESGRLEGRVESLENALRVEREARRRLVATMKRERKAAEALQARAEKAEAASAAHSEEATRLRESLSVAEQQIQLAWAHCSDIEQQLAVKSRPLWRKMLRRPPAQ